MMRRFLLVVTVVALGVAGLASSSACSSKSDADAPAGAATPAGGPRNFTLKGKVK